MKKKMLQFLNLNQTTPVKRKESVRKKDFHEIYKDYITEKAEEQAAVRGQLGLVIRN